MFALSRDGRKFFVHQPDEGMRIPVLLDFESKKLTVRMPSITELENDYAVYEEINELVKVLSAARKRSATTVVEISKIFSAKLDFQLSNEKLKISELRALFVDIWNNAPEIQHAPQFQAKSVSRKTHQKVPTEITKSFTVS